MLASYLFLRVIFIVFSFGNSINELNKIFFPKKNIAPEMHVQQIAPDRRLRATLIQQTFYEYVLKNH